jgi:HlyD family secretion protein
MTGVAGEQRSSSALERAEKRGLAPERLAAVEALERELLSRQRWRFWKIGLGLLLLAAAALGVQRWQRREQPKPPERFVTAPLEVRDIFETVESSGKLRPLREVKVGTQISGRVVRVHVDFNRAVKKGDLLAEIDPSLFGDQVSQVAGQLGAAEAQLERARAAQQTAELQLERLEKLRSENIASQSDLDQAQNAVRLAKADALSAGSQVQGLTAQLRSANTTLAYTKIYSPIDGIVTDRSVDPGQTVASSFSAPVLFVIAEDLSAMQVLADIDEADVGKITQGMLADVRVDAFPDRSFKGALSQIRYSPTEVQGVVTYAAVVDVTNDALELRPGMTATVSITARSAKGVLSAPSPALRFKPKPSGPVTPGADALAPGQRRLYVQAEPELASHVVTIGISDGVWTELTASDMKAGTLVVTQERAPADEKRRKFLGIF